MKVDFSNPENLLHEYGRMCAENDCASCHITKFKDNKDMYKDIECAEFLRDYPVIAKRIIMTWSEQHPVKTYRDDFFEKFPKAPRKGNGGPLFEPCKVYGRICGDSCDDCIGCNEFWDEAYEEWNSM